MTQEGERLILENCGNGTGQNALDYMRSMALPNIEDSSPISLCNKYLTVEDCKRNAPRILNQIIEKTRPPVPIDLDKEEIITPIIDFAERLSRHFENHEDFDN